MRIGTALVVWLLIPAVGAAQNPPAGPPPAPDTPQAQPPEAPAPGASGTQATEPATAPEPGTGGAEPPDEAPGEAQEAPAEADLPGRVSTLEAEMDELKALKLTDPLTMRAYWKDGYRIETNDKNFTLRIGGRVHLDWGWFTHVKHAVQQHVNGSGDTLGDQQDGVEFRRARLALQGTIHKVFNYKLQYDFAGGDADFKDVFMGLTEIPYVGNVRVGHFKEPFGLEQLTSSNDITFMERSLPDLFTPERNTGVMLHNAILEECATWQVGVFRETNDFGNDIGDGDYNWTARVTGVPIYEEDGRRILHLGLATRLTETNDNTAQFATDPEIHLVSTDFIDTGPFAASDDQRVGGELALVFGPLSLQSEAMYTHVNGIQGNGDPDFWGWYIFTTYTLTGESRPYKTESGHFSRIKPEEPFLVDGGIGAWELALRYSYSDLTSSGINGGSLNNLTAGVNWYLNANYIVKLNYVYSYLEGVGDVQAFMMRFELAL